MRHGNMNPRGFPTTATAQIAATAARYGFPGQLGMFPQPFPRGAVLISRFFALPLSAVHEIAGNPVPSR
jgi:hypothetical protein